MWPGHRFSSSTMHHTLCNSLHSFVVSCSGGAPKCNLPRVNVDREADQRADRDALDEPYSRQPQHSKRSNHMSSSGVGDFAHSTRDFPLSQSHSRFPLRRQHCNNRRPVKLPKKNRKVLSFDGPIIDITRSNTCLRMRSCCDW